MPKIGLAVIVMRNDSVLLGKRKNAHGEGTYAFPGGHLEMWEEFVDCAEREVKEETGLGIELIDNYPVAPPTNDFFKEDDKHYVTLFIRAEYIGGTPRVMEPDKCEKWDWYKWGNLPQPLMLPIQNLIKQGYNPFKNLRWQ